MPSVRKNREDDVVYHIKPNANVSYNNVRKQKKKNDMGGAKYMLPVVDLLATGPIGAEAGAMRWGMGIAWTSIRAAKAAKAAMAARAVIAAAESAKVAARAAALDGIDVAVQGGRVATKQSEGAGLIQQLQAIKDSLSKLRAVRVGGRVAKKTQALAEEAVRIKEKIESIGFKAIAKMTGSDEKTVEKAYNMAKMIIEETIGDEELEAEGHGEHADSIFHPPEEYGHYNQYRYTPHPYIPSNIRSYNQDRTPANNHVIQNSAPDHIFHVKQNQYGSVIMPHIPLSRDPTPVTFTHYGRPTQAPTPTPTPTPTPKPSPQAPAVAAS